MKISIVLFFLLTANNLFTQTNSINDFYFKKVNTLMLITNYHHQSEYKVIKKEKPAFAGKISRAEILYGKFENIDANILIARETENIDYIINYNRFKIDSYEAGGKKIYNSSYGYDHLKSGINLLKDSDYLMTFNFDYQYGLNGMHNNTNYNNQIKRTLIFSPEFNYFFSEKSYFDFKFLFSDLKLEFESPQNNLKNQYSFFQTKIKYKRIWSSINSFYFEFFSILDSLKINNTYNNNFAYFKLSDKFALSKKFTINLSLKFNVNKNYPFVISPSANLFFIFKHFNIQTGYKHNYDYLNFYNHIKENKFYKLSSGNKPTLVNEYYSTVFINIADNVTYNINFSYNDVTHFPEIKEDVDKILLLMFNNQINYFQITQEISFKINRHFQLSLNHIYRPHQKPDKISNLIRNIFCVNPQLNYSIINTGLILKYYDLNYFIDNENNYTIIKSNILMDIYFKAYFTKTFGLKIKIKNVTNKKIILTPGYPEIENIFNIGVIAEF